MKKVVTVTKEDIAKGSKGECNMCPIAVALRRVFKKATAVCVTDCDAEVYVFDKYMNCVTLSASLPTVARKFVPAFDCGEAVKPFKFTANFK